MAGISTTYYDLKDENSLPLGTKFVDPYDNTIYVVKPRETLAQLMTRISEHREQSNHPMLSPPELKALVISFLAETCDVKTLHQYFKPMAIHPQFSQVFSLARAVTHEIIHSQDVSPAQRAERAKHCLACPKHEARAVPPKLVNIALSGIFSNRSFEGQNELGRCGMCGCGLVNKVKFQVINILAELHPEQIDLMLRLVGKKAFDICWIFKEAINNPTTKRLLESKMKAGRAGGMELLQENLRDKVAAAKKRGTDG